MDACGNAKGPREENFLHTKIFTLEMRDIEVDISWHESKSQPSISIFFSWQAYILLGMDCKEKSFPDIFPLSFIQQDYTLKVGIHISFPLFLCEPFSSTRTLDHCHNSVSDSIGLSLPLEILCHCPLCSFSSRKLQSYFRLANTFAEWVHIYPGPVHFEPEYTLTVYLRPVPVSQQNTLTSTKHRQHDQLHIPSHLRHRSRMQPRLPRKPPP